MIYDPIEGDTASPPADDETPDLPAAIGWLIEVYATIRDLCANTGWECERISSRDATGEGVRVVVVLRRNWSEEEGIL